MKTENNYKKRLTGRPKLSEDELLKYRITFKCDKKEFDQLSARAKIAGLSEGQFSKAVVFRSQSFFTSNPRETIEGVKAVSKEMNPVGNNLNQLARHANLSFKSGIVDKETFVKMNELVEKFITKQNEILRLNMNLLKTRR